MTEKEFIKLANKILYVKQSAITPFGGKKSELKGLKKLYKAINYRPCCTSKAEQLCDKNDYGKIVAIHRFEKGEWVEYRNDQHNCVQRASVRHVLMCFTYCQAQLKIEI